MVHDGIVVKRSGQTQQCMLRPRLAQQVQAYGQCGRRLRVQGCTHRRAVPWQTQEISEEDISEHAQEKPTITDTGDFAIGREHRGEHRECRGDDG